MHDMHGRCPVPGDVFIADASPSPVSRPPMCASAMAVEAAAASKVARMFLEAALTAIHPDHTHVLAPPLFRR